MKKHLTALLLLAWASIAWAEVVVTASVDKTDMTKTDELHYTVTVTGARGEVSTPQFSLPGFNRYYMLQSEQIINGRQTNTYTYTLLPRFVGAHTIGPAEIVFNGDVYKSEPVTVRVYSDEVPATSTQAGKKDSRVDPNLPPLEKAIRKQAAKNAGKPVFMTAAVSDATPYVNQPVTLSVRFYYSVELHNNAPYTKPSVSNIFMEKTGSSEGRQLVGNTYYSYFEERYQLSGVAVGEAVVGPATVRYYTAATDSVFGMLDHFLGGTALGKEESVSSNPLRLNIKALPTQGKPSSFYGAVGSGYTLAAKADRDQVEAGEAITFTITVQGPGNLKSTGDLKIPEVEGFKTYPATPVSNWVGNNKTRSFKTFKTVFVPNASGVYTIPPVSWSYFDPSENDYKTLATKALDIEVTPSTRQDRGVNFAAATAADNGFQTLGQDIHYLKSAAAPKAGFLAKLGGLGVLNWLAVLWLAGCIFFCSVGKKSLALKHAFTTARAHLKKAKNYEDVSDTLAVYLQQKFNISIGSTPLRTVEQELKEKGVAQPVIGAFSAFWQQLANYRFAPSGGGENLDAVCKQALEIVKQLEAGK